MSTPQTKQRVYIVVVIVSGVLTTSLIWKSLHRVDPMADQTAIGAGFASQNNADETMRYFERAKSLGRLEIKDFADIQDLLARGNRGERRAALLALKYVKGADQFRQALAVADKVGISHDLAGEWRIAFVSWISYQHDPSALPLLLASKNPQVVEIAKDLKNAG